MIAKMGILIHYQDMIIFML